LPHQGCEYREEKKEKRGINTPVTSSEMELKERRKKKTREAGFARPIIRARLAKKKRREGGEKAQAP